MDAPNPDNAASLAARIAARTATVSVIGPGYVGLPLARVFVERGFRVLGFDTGHAKVAALAERRRSPALDHAVVQRTVPVSSAATAEAVTLARNVIRPVDIPLENTRKSVFDAIGIDVCEVTRPPPPRLSASCLSGQAASMTTIRTFRSRAAPASIPASPGAAPCRGTPRDSAPTTRR